VAALGDPRRPLIALRTGCHGFFSLPEPQQIAIKLLTRRLRSARSVR
jgi:hypothetical protein